MLSSHLTRICTQRIQILFGSSWLLVCTYNVYACMHGFMHLYAYICGCCRAMSVDLLTVYPWIIMIIVWRLGLAGFIDRQHMHAIVYFSFKEKKTKLTITWSTEIHKNVKTKPFKFFPFFFFISIKIQSTYFFFFIYGYYDVPPYNKQINHGYIGMHALLLHTYTQTYTS